MRSKIRTATLFAIGASLALTTARPVVTELNEEATAEAQQRDATATRAFSGIEIKSGDRCLSVDELSGDFRANLTPIQVSTCDNSAGQKWDVISSGKHNDQPGNVLVVSALTQACMNFDPRRAAGNQVILFSCGGRADGGGAVTDSQLFPLADGTGAGPLSLTPKNAPGTCFTVKGDVIDQAACADGDANQSFTFGGSEAAAPADAGADGEAAAPEAADTEDEAAAPAPAAESGSTAASAAPAKTSAPAAADEGASALSFDCSG